MIIYFAGSIRGGRDDRKLYHQLIEYLATYGQVLTEHVGDQELEEFGEAGPPDEDIYHRDMNWISQSDVVVAEVSKPSLGVGYEISKAEDMGKKVLCLYRYQKGKRLSGMLSGNPGIQIARYATLEGALKHIDHFLGCPRA